MTTTQAAKDYANERTDHIFPNNNLWKDIKPKLTELIELSFDAGQRHYAAEVKTILDENRQRQNAARDYIQEKFGLPRNNAPAMPEEGEDG